MRGPKHYGSIEEFEREEIAPHKKAGWCLDDLYADATFNPGEDDSYKEERSSELNFDY